MSSPNTNASSSASKDMHIYGWILKWTDNNWPLTSDFSSSSSFFAWTIISGLLPSFNAKDSVSSPSSLDGFTLTGDDLTGEFFALFWAIFASSSAATARAAEVAAVAIDARAETSFIFRFRGSPSSMEVMDGGGTTLFNKLGFFNNCRWISAATLEKLNSLSGKMFKSVRARPCLDWIRKKTNIIIARLLSIC